jgi:hypothetical protein
MNYYKNQLEKLPNKKEAYSLNIRISGTTEDGEELIKTHHMALNKESIPVLIEYLENLMNQC